MEFSESLKKNKDFQFIYRNGRSFANRYLIMYLYKKKQPSETAGTKCAARNRIGISVSKKVGNSVVRHRLTRLIRESYRLNEKKFVGGLDLIVIARPGAKERNFFEIESALLHLAKMHGILAMNSEKNEKDFD